MPYFSASSRDGIPTLSSSFPSPPPNNSNPFPQPTRSGCGRPHARRVYLRPRLKNFSRSARTRGPCRARTVLPGWRSECRTKFSCSRNSCRVKRRHRSGCHRAAPPDSAPPYQDRNFRRLSLCQVPHHPKNQDSCTPPASRAGGSGGAEPSFAKRERCRPQKSLTSSPPLPCPNPRRLRQRPLRSVLRRLPP